MYNIEKVLTERKTNKYGFRFRPSIMKILELLATKNDTSKADYLEVLILEQAKKEDIVK